MATIEERLEAIAQNLELATLTLAETQKIVNVLAEDQAKTAKVMGQIAVLVRDHEHRLRDLES
jgi:hypothetical protein